MTLAYRAAAPREKAHTRQAIKSNLSGYWPEFRYHSHYDFCGITGWVYVQFLISLN
jgi:hypothetical protein